VLPPGEHNGTIDTTLAEVCDMSEWPSSCRVFHERDDIKETCSARIFTENCPRLGLYRT